MANVVPLNKSPAPALYVVLLGVPQENVPSPTDLKNCPAVPLPATAKASAYILLVKSKVGLVAPLTVAVNTLVPEL